MTQWIMQSPSEVRAHSIDWESEIQEGEEIDQSVWSISPDEGAGTGEALEDPTIDTSAKLTAVSVAGLQIGKSYQLKNTITTTDDRILSKEITIRCGKRQ